MKDNNTIFKNGSKTFYTASLFFPKEIRQNVTRLYAFVRIADDFVDQKPQDKKGFFIFKKQTEQAFALKHSPNTVINDFVLLCEQHNIEKKWVDAFLDVMEQDLRKNKYYTFKELEDYMYGSAEVIGLMMARLMKLPKKAESAARLQGKAMQLINFIRDIKEDLELGRQYLPQEDLEKFGIKELSSNVNKNSFRNLVKFEIQRYKNLQAKAKRGYSYIPYLNRIPIATAAALYEWTAQQIEKDPMKVFQSKIKPSKPRIFGQYIKQFFNV